MLKSKNRNWLVLVLIISSFFANAQKNLVISGGNTVSSFVCGNQKAYVWGDNTAGQLGAGLGGANYNTPQPVPFPGNPSVVQVNSGSGSHFVALTCSGDVWAWGVNGNGQIGIGSAGGVVTTPTRVLADPSIAAVNRNASNQLQNASVVYSGTSNTFAILNDTKLVAWGANSGTAQGQLGNGGSTDLYTAHYVLNGSTGLPLTGVTQIFAGDNVTYALVDPTNSGVGTVYSWGYGLNGTLGRDAAGTGNPSLPTTVQDSYARPVYYANGTPMNNITQLQAGDVFGIALDVNGYIWTWGNGAWNNATGNTTINYKGSDPRQVIKGNTTGASNDGTYLLAKAIGGGQGYGMAVTKDGKPVAWGGTGACLNGGMTGTGPTNTTAALPPTYIQRTGGIIDNNVTLINRGDTWGFYGTSNNDYYAWGCNLVGQLGIGNNTNQDYATLITPPTGCSFRDPVPFAALNHHDTTVCQSTFTPLTLNSGFSVAAALMSNYKVTWTRNGTVVQSGLASIASNLSYSASQNGKFVVDVSYVGTNSGCSTYPDAIDAIIISYFIKNFTVPTPLTFCGTTINPYVNGLGNYNWYKNSAGGVSLATTQQTNKASILVSALNAPVAGVTTVYVEETGQYVGNLGKVTPTNCGTSTTQDDNNSRNMVFNKVSSLNLVIDTVYVWVQNDGLARTFAINVYDTKLQGANWVDNNTLYTSSTVALTLPAAAGNTLVKIPVNYTLTGAAGLYYSIGLKNLGNNNIKIIDFGCNTFKNDDIATGGPYLTSNGTSKYTGWSNDWGPIANVVFHTPMGFCDRVPVTLTQSCPCTKPTAVVITAPATTPTNLCQGTAQTLSGTATVGAASINGGFTYSWRKTLPTLTVLNAPTVTPLTIGTATAVPSNTTAITGLVLDAGTYVLRVEDGSAGLAACYTEATVVINVNPTLVPSVAIAVSPTGAICAGGSVTFTATPTNGGTTPTYQWKLAGANITGATNATYTTTTAANGDSYTVTLTSNATCASPTTATSTAIVMTVNPVLVPSVAIAVSPTGAICAGASVTFTATPTNGGTTPTYQWKLAGVNITGATNATYTTTTAANGDSYTVTLTSNATCASPTTATSTAIVMTVNPVLVPSVAIAVSPTGAICAGASLTFTATPTNGGTPTYQWKKGGVNIVGETNATYTTTIAANGDSYTVTMTSNALCASPTTATSTAIVTTVNPVLVPSVAIAVAPTGAICAGASVTFTATPTNGGTTPTYQWKKGGVNIASATNATYTTTGAANADSYTVTLTSNATCVSPTTATSSAIVMTVNPILPVSVLIATPSTTICAGTSVTFTATPTNGGTTPTYVWKKNTVVIGGATNSTYSTTAATNGDTYTVVMTSNATCPSGNPATSNAVVITVTTVVVPAVSITAAPAGAICAGASVTFTAVPGNGGATPTYQWKKGGVNIAAATNVTFTSTTLANGDQISVDMVSNSGCASTPNASSNIITMVVNPNVTPSVIIAVAPTGAICAGASLTFTATPTNGGAGPTYQWRKGGVNIASATNATYITTTAANADSYDVVMTSTATCATPATATSNAIVITVTPTPTPSVSIVADKPVICSGQTVVFTATPVQGGLTPVYVWKNNGLVIAGETTASLSISTLGTPNSITVEMVSNAVCAPATPVASNAIVTTVNAGIGAGTIGNPQTICYNSIPATINQLTAATGVTAAATYTWEASLNGVTGWGVIPGATNTSYTPPVAITADVYVRRVVLDGSLPAPCNTATTPSVRITVRPILVAGVIAADQIICSGVVPATITQTTAPTGGTQTFTYQWQSDAATIGVFVDISGATNSSYTSAAITRTTQFQRTEISGGSCGSITSNIVTKTVTAPETVTAVIDNASAQVCASAASIVFTATGSSTTGTGTLSYQWYLGSVSATNAVGTNSSTYTYAPVSTNDNGKQVNLVVTTSNGCNSGPGTAMPYVLDIVGSITPTISISVNHNPNCAGIPTTFTATSTGGGSGATYQWYLVPFATGTPQGVGTGGTTYTSSTLADRDSVYVEMTSSSTCLAAGLSNPFQSNKIRMQIKLIPAPSIVEGDQTVCSPIPGSFTFHGSVRPGNTYQWKLNNVAITGATNADYTATQSGTYTLNEDNGICNSTSAPVVLTVIQTPIANAGADIYMKEGDLGNLNGSGGAVYSWSPSTYLSSAVVSNPNFQATQTITYTLTVSAPSNPLCFTTANVTVFVVKPIKVPNVITVNGDGVNDDWVIENIEGYPNVIIEIYNRWGNLVWKSQGYPKNWDGTNFRNGQVLPDGTYFYIINLQSQVYNEPLTGWVQIIK